MGKSGSFLGTCLPVSVLLLAISLVFLPNMVWNFLMVVDFFTPYNIWNDPIANRYHQFLMSRLPVIPEKPVTEIDVSEASLEKILELTNGYRDPLVIRGGMKDAEAVKIWNDINFWVDNYGDEEVMCGQSGTAKEPQLMTLREALTNDDPWYVAGDVTVLSKYPDLFDMLKDPKWDGNNTMVDGEYVFPNLFIGKPGMGSDIHTAIALNIFRMIAGRKKWYLIPNNQSPYVFGQQNPGGFSAISKAAVGHEDSVKPEWFDKIDRYTVELVAGDVLVNTAWLWHGTHNLVLNSKDELNIGVATRFKVGYHRSARNNVLQTLMAAYMGIQQTDSKSFADKLLEQRKETNEGNEQLD